MFEQSSSIRYVLDVLCCCGLLAASGIPALAEAPSEKPLALAFSDAQLSWGPCPSLFPKGCEIAVLHGDAAKPNADVFFKVPAKYDIPTHWHTSAERMVPPKAPHKASCADSGPCVLFIAFESAVDAHPPKGD
jgi:hypothetical protein